MLTIRLTIFLALLAYFAAECGWLARPANRWSIRLWVVAWLFLLAHFWAAFALHHHWSHAHAVAETADKTARVTGWRFGGGVWVNYALALAWTADIAARVGATAGPPPWWRLGFRGVLGFLVFQATVVFGSPPAQVLGGIGLLAQAIAAFTCRRGQSLP